MPDFAGKLAAVCRDTGQFPVRCTIRAANNHTTTTGHLGRRIAGFKKGYGHSSIDQLIDKVNTHKMEANLADLVKLDPPSTTNTVTKTH